MTHSQGLAGEVGTRQNKTVIKKLSFEIQKHTSWLAPSKKPEGSLLAKCGLSQIGRFERALREFS